jgi:drug/metabolite transporter (DMT)-like permease
VPDLASPAPNPVDQPAGRAFRLLFIVGALLAFAVLLSKIAADHAAPMLSYLCLAMGASGAVLTRMAGVNSRGETRPVSLAWYSVIAGGLIALGSALGYLAVHKVGAAFIVLAMAFPPLLTWLLSLVFGLERFDLYRLIGLLTGLAGGVLLAVGKGLGASSADSGAIMLACAMPAVLAVGNVFRTRFWPKGASPRLLAGLMLVCGALVTLPFALWFEGGAALGALFRPPMQLILVSAVIVFVAQYAAFFKLQQIAGPVYLSQIGSVAALVGSPIAVLVLGERLPQGFGLAATLIIVGLGIFQYRAAHAP